MFRTILRQQWKERGQKPTSYIVSLASVLIKIAAEWVKVPPEQLAALKEIRSKLGRTRSGLTEKNKAMLRRFDDPRLLGKLINLPDVLWRTARRNLPLSTRWFVDLQTALAIDILLHVAPRIENLAALKFDEHLHWPQGKGKPALMVIREDETKNEEPLEFELPSGAVRPSLHLSQRDCSSSDRAASGIPLCLQEWETENLGRAASCNPADGASGAWV